MWSNDTVPFAVRKGLYPAAADPLLFSFSDTFAPVDFAGARLGEARAYNMLKQVSDDDTFAQRYLDYAQGYNLSNRMPLHVNLFRGQDLTAFCFVVADMSANVANDCAATALLAQFTQCGFEMQQA
jgi:hypothetical protein